jgi:hypothetical protein
MRGNTTLKAMLVVAALCSAATIGAAQQRPGYHDIAVPPTAGVYPASPEGLVDMRNFERVADLRKHAWALFAGVTAPTGTKKDPIDPVWTTWFTQSEAFGIGCSESSAKRTSPRFEFQLPMEIVANFEARGRSQDNVQEALKDAVAFFSNPATGALRSAVLYNKTACEHILNNQLFSGRKLSDELKTFISNDTPPEEMEVDQFPRGAIVVKSSWLRIDAGGRTVCLWRPADTTVSNECQLVGMHELRVTPVASAVPCRILPRQPIPTSCFYNIPVTPLNMADLSRSMTVQPGDALILVGLHVITKEIGDWVWSTFWWQAGPDSKGFPIDQPPNLFGSPWNNYAMDVTLSMETPHEEQSAIVTAPGKCLPRRTPNPKICFNPYLEGSLTNGQYSNCMNCHKQATFQRFIPDPTGTVQRGYLGSDAQCFTDKERPVMRVDYLWTLSPIPVENPLRNFLDQLLKDLKITLPQTLGSLQFSHGNKTVLAHLVVPGDHSAQNRMFSRDLTC